MNEKETGQVKRSISRQFVLSVLVIVAVLVGVITIFTSRLLTNFYKDQIQTEIRNTSEFIKGTISTFISGAYNMTYELASNREMLTMDGEVQAPILRDTAHRNDYFEVLYTQGLDGMQIARSAGELGDRSNRWWFKKMMDDRRPFVSQSYYAIGTRMPSTSIFLPMYIGSEMVGILGANIKLGYIQQLIGQFAERDRGRYSFIVDGDGVVMAHPDSTYLETLVDYKKLTRTVSQKDESGSVILDGRGEVWTQEEPLEISDSFKSVMASVLRGQKGVADVELDGHDYFASYTPVNLPGFSDAWAVVTLQDEAIVTDMVSRLVRDVILITFVITVIAAAAILAMTRRITIPLGLISDAAHRFADGDFGARVDYKSENEIGLLADTFNQMAGDIVKNMEALEAATAERERVESELRIASKIQSDLLPDVDKHFYNNPLADISALVHPALEMGGDLYDTFFVDEEKRKLCMVVADVSGKGVPAAMFMVVARTLVRNYALSGDNPPVILEKANNYLCVDNPDSMFVTMFISIMDLVDGSCQYSHAGHNPIAFCPKGGEFTFMELEQSMPLGFFPGSTYTLYEKNIAGGDRFFMYTDGVTEALDKDDTEWGDSTLLNALNSYLDLPCDEIMKRIREDIKKHAKDAPQSDDITILVAKRREEGE